jgi:4-amino-4-deoxy-L-arabinose transferase-like glycosyltransferase
MLNTSTDKKFYLFLLFAFILKLVLVPFAQVIDADAVTRTLITINWLEHPYWMDTAIWAPFHFYYNSIALLIWNNPMYAPVVLNVIFSCLTLIPFYNFVKREFNANGALFASFFLFLTPVLFRISFLALAEIPFLFFIALTLNLLSKGIRENKIGFILIAGLSMTIASGFRYDAWLLIGFFGIVILLFNEWKKAFLFSIIASVFPLLWMWTNYLATGNALHSINGNYNYTLELIGVNENISFEAYLRRIWFFPFSLFITLGPPLFYICLKSIFKSYKSQLSKVWIWSIPFWLVFLFYLYNSLKGNLLLHHRLTGTLILFSIPFAAIYFKDVSKTKIRQAFLFVTMTIGLTFVYNMNGITPFPRLKDQQVVKISSYIKQEINSQSGLIIDFWGWENSYYIALDAGIRPKQIVFILGEKNAKFPMRDCVNLIKDQITGVILIVKESVLDKTLKDVNSELSKIIASTHSEITLDEREDIRILKWKRNYN